MEHKSKGTSSIEELARIFNKTMTNVMPTNVEQNSTLWDNYARDWSVDKEFVKKMLNDNRPEEGAENDITLGEEWSNRESFEQVLVSPCSFESSISE